MRTKWVVLLLVFAGFSGKARAADIQPVVLTPTTNSAVVTFRVNKNDSSRSSFTITTDLNTIFGKNAVATNLSVVILYLGSAAFQANVSGTTITGTQINGKILRNARRTMVLNANGLDLASLLNLNLEKAGNMIAPADVAITAVLPGSGTQQILFSAYGTNAGILYHVKGGIGVGRSTISPVISASSSGISSSGVITSSGITSSGITTSTSGITTSGITTSGITTTSTSGTTTSGITTSGMTTSGITTSGITTSGITTSGVTTSGITTSGVTTSGVTTTTGITTTTTSGVTTSGITTTSGVTTSGITTTTSGVTSSSSGTTTSGITTTTTGITTTSGTTTSSSGTTTSGTTTSGTTSSGFTQSRTEYNHFTSS